MLTNGGLDLDQRGLISDRLGFFNSLVDSIDIVVTISNYNGVPAISFEALDGVFGEGDFSGAIDGDFVVIIQSNELAKLPVTSEHKTHRVVSVSVSSRFEGGGSFLLTQQER